MSSNANSSSNDRGGVVDESGPLLPASSASPAGGRRSRSTSRISEYESLGLTVVLDTTAVAAPTSSSGAAYSCFSSSSAASRDQRPVLMHDFSGPILNASLTSHQQHLQHDSGNGMASSDHASSDALSDAANVILERLSAAGGGGTVEESMLVMDNLPPSEDPVGQATIPSEIASMAKNLIGCGCLSLSNGIARCANNSRALWTANSWIVLLGFIFGYFCYLIAKICHLTGRTTYRGIWEETVGHRGSVAVSVANALKAAMADLAYATILSDTLKSLLLGFFGWEVPRVSCLLLITGCAILPLCLLKSLNVLAPFSLLGTAGVVFTAGSMVVRYLDGSYQVGGKFHNDIPGEYLPRFGGVDESWSTAILPFVCMVYEAYVMHYNSARFYTELKDRTLPRFAIAVSSSFGIAAAAYMAIASFGFLTFGGASSGFILNNYSPYDPLANISRVAIGISVLTAYPIVFFGVRDGCLDMFEVPAEEQTPAKINSLTLLLLSILTLTAVFVTDLGLINAVGGGLVATAIVFVFPTLMFYKVLLQRMAIGFPLKTPEWKELYGAAGMTVIGVVIGLIGAYTAVADGNGGGGTTSAS